MVVLKTKTKMSRYFFFFTFLYKNVVYDDRLIVMYSLPVTIIKKITWSYSKNQSARNRNFVGTYQLFE